MKKIEIRCHVIIVDDDMEQFVLSKKWSFSGVANGRYYAKLSTGVKLHQIIVGKVPPGYCIDHINGNGLDNRRENLRICTYSQNNMNHGPSIKRRSSPYRGVVFNKKRNKYEAHIKIGGKMTYIGLFSTAKEAAVAYNKMAKKHFGEFAWVNPIC